MSKFLPIGIFKRIDGEFNLNKYTSNSSKGCVLPEYSSWMFFFKVDIEYPKELPKLHNDYPLALDKIEIKGEIPSDYQLKIGNLYNIPIGNVKKLVPNVFDREKYASLWKLTTILKTRIKTKKIHRVLEFNQSQCLKPHIKFNTQKRIEAEKNNDKNGKALYKLMNNGKYEKPMETLRNRIDVKLKNNEKGYLKWHQNETICRTKYLTII